MLAVIALVIVNTLRYEYTWDIVKFGTVAFIALAIAAGMALSELAVWADNRSRKLVYALIVIALVGRGAAYPFVALSAYDPEVRQGLSIQMIRPYLSTAYPVDNDDAEAVSFLRAHMAPFTGSPYGREVRTLRGLGRTSYPGFETPCGQRR